MLSVSKDCVLEDAYEPSNRLTYAAVGQTDFPSSEYFISKFKIPPSNFSTNGNHFFDKSFWFWLQDNIGDLTLIWTTNGLGNKKEYTSSCIFESSSRKLLFKIAKENELKSFGSTNLFMVMYFADRSLIEDIFSVFPRFHIKNVVNKASNINLVVQQGDNLNTNRYPVKIKDLDVELNYGSGFIPVYNKIIKALNTKNNKGIILFHGTPGTGKTSLIKYISKKIKKEMIFVPPSMAEAISAPNFIPFLMNHSNSVLVIEDAERILMDRNQYGSNQGVSNILNLSDGILGDCLNIQVIATFNTSLKDIDSALLRKGRLIAEHEFKELSVEHSNKLLQHLGKSYVTTKPMTLTNIYNIEEEEFKSTQERRAVGFNTK